jgi:hypothetical protein
MRKAQNGLSSAVFKELLIFQRGDVVQLVRTLPCHEVPNLAFMLFG